MLGTLPIDVTINNGSGIDIVIVPDQSGVQFKILIQTIQEIDSNNGTLSQRKIAHIYFGTDFLQKLLFLFHWTL
jgi:hypothetical protein